MKRIKLCFILFIQVAFLCRSSAQDMTAEKVINNALESMGGKEYIQSIRTLYSTMNTVMDGHAVQCIIREMVPNKGSFEVIYQGRSVYKTWFDGKQGYEMTNGQKKDADPETFKDKLYKKSIMDEVDYLDPSLWKIEMAGDDKVNAEDCYKIKGTLANGMVRNMWYSKTTFYCLKTEDIKGEKNSPKVFLLSGYQQFGRLNYYTIMTSIEDGKTSVIKMDNVVVNEMVTEQDFK